MLGISQHEKWRQCRRGASRAGSVREATLMRPPVYPSRSDIPWVTKMEHAVSVNVNVNVNTITPSASGCCACPFGMPAKKG